MNESSKNSIVQIHTILSPEKFSFFDRCVLARLNVLGNKSRIQIIRYQSVAQMNGTQTKAAPEEAANRTQS